MIKLLRAKEDIYWENPHDGEEPFCTKDTWYEVIKQSGNRVTFKNDMEIDHHWNINEVDEDFWTIDFEEGFEVVNTNNSKLVFKDNKFHNITQNLYDLTVDYISKKLYKDFILEGVFTVTKYSNQQAVKPIEQERPYENWKMSISKDKFTRCISDSRILDYQTVEGIIGFLNKDEAIFYYSPSANKYIAAKVYPFKYPDDSEGWEFVKENCDSLQKSIVPEVNDALVSSASKKSDILETVESTKNSILASFGVPKDNLGNNYISNNTTVKEDVVNTIGWDWQEESEEYWEKVKSSEGVNASLGCDEDEYTGGSVNYYKLFVENPTNLPESYEVECNDIIEALDMNYAEGNAFKAIWRKCAAKKFGIKKKGYDNGLYDSEKVVFFGERMVEQSK